MDKKTAIKQLKQMAENDPAKYDLSKLNDAIEMINRTNDVDALLILGKPQDVLLRPNLYVFAQEEIDKMSEAIAAAGFSVKEVKRLEEENGRDDYAFVLTDENKKVVWISKMRPLWNDGEYNLLAVGFNFPALSFQTFDELVEKTVNLLNSDY